MQQSALAAVLLPAMLRAAAAGCEVGACDQLVDRNFATSSPPQKLTRGLQLRPFPLLFPCPAAVMAEVQEQSAAPAPSAVPQLSAEEERRQRLKAGEHDRLSELCVHSCEAVKLRLVLLHASGALSRCCRRCAAAAAAATGSRLLPLVPQPPFPVFKLCSR